MVSQGSTMAVPFAAVAAAGGDGSTGSGVGESPLSCWVAPPPLNCGFCGTVQLLPSFF